MENKKRLIDANALQDEVRKSKDGHRHLDPKVAENHHMEHDVFLELVDYAPTVDAVEVVHARWENVQNGKGCCSNCNRLDSIDNLATHCRYCGAKMDGERKDNALPKLQK